MMRKLKKFLLDHFELSLVVLIIVGILVIIFLVHYKLAFLNFFFLPVILSGYFLGKKQAVLTASFCILLVILYLAFANTVFGRKVGAMPAEIISLVVWAGFLILTAGIIGIISEQREAKICNLRRAYVGVLKIMLKYLELADEEKPRSLRMSLLAGKVAKAAALSTRDVENIKTAALLVSTGDLRSSLPLFDEVEVFMKDDIKTVGTQLCDKERVLLQTTASLLKDVRPILIGYFQHYVEEADILDKKLENIPLASSIIAVADLYDRLTGRVGQGLEKWDVRTPEDIEKLAGRLIPVSVVRALQEAVSVPE